LRRCGLPGRPCRPAGLQSVKTAQQSSKSTARVYAGKASLVASKAIQPNDALDVQTDASGSCYVAVARSESGKVFFLTSAKQDPQELPVTADTGCIAASTVTTMVDALGGFGEASTAVSALSIEYPTAVFNRSSSAVAETLSPAVGGAEGALTYSVSGTLPYGVSFNASTGKFTGTSWGKDASAASAGSGFGCALSNGTASCWGTNTYGQLGNGTTTPSKVPVPVTGLEGKQVTAVSAGEDAVCAIADGAAYCWATTPAANSATAPWMPHRSPRPSPGSCWPARRSLRSALGRRLPARR
jgi:hypothetical protein